MLAVAWGSLVAVYQVPLKVSPSLKVRPYALIPYYHPPSTLIPKR